MRMRTVVVVPLLSSTRGFSIVGIRILWCIVISCMFIYSSFIWSVRGYGITNAPKTLLDTDVYSTTSTVLYEGAGNSVHVDIDGLMIEDRYELAVEESSGTVSGYVYIPSTKVNYPVMYDEGDNYYLTHNRVGNKSAAGEVYKDIASNSRVTLIHGHHIRDGSMFTNLELFKDQEWFDKWVSETGGYVYYFDGDLGVTEAYRVVSVNLIPASSETISMSMNNSYIQSLIDRSVIDAQSLNEQIDTDNGVMVLNTCSYEGDNYRTVLVMVREKW